MELIFQQKSIGRFFLDFLVEEKIIVELKQGGRFSKNHFDQVTGYLKTHGAALGILANFTQDGVVCKRVLNPEQRKIHS